MLATAQDTAKERQRGPEAELRSLQNRVMRYSCLRDSVPGHQADAPSRQLLLLGREGTFYRAWCDRSHIGVEQDSSDPRGE
jgi:hypothetical protein